MHSTRTTWPWPSSLLDGPRTFGFFATDRLDEAKGRKLLWDTPMEEKWIVKTHAVLDQVVAEAAKQRVG